jgi:hypothetical protein
MKTMEEEHEVNPSELSVRELANICNTYRELGCSGCPFCKMQKSDIGMGFMFFHRKCLPVSQVTKVKVSK